METLPQASCQSPPRLLCEFLKSHVAPKKKTRILIACSGGPDSVALVQAAAQLEEMTEFEFLVGHVNHKLRGAASEGDERFVLRLCKRLGMPCLVKKAAVKAGAPGNLEENARDKRYAALADMALKHKCQFVLTSHTMDDQAETFLMNVLRGSGVDGMGGIPFRRRLNMESKVEILRPFLLLRKVELLAWLRGLKVSYRKDKSNEQINFFRNWIRHKLTPLIEKKAPGFQRRIANTALLLHDEKQFWNGYLSRVESDVLRVGSKGQLLDFRRLLSYPPAVQRRFLRSILGRDLMGFEAVDKLRRWMSAPPSSGRLWQLRKGWTVERLSKTQGSPTASVFQVNSPYSVRKEK